MRKILAIRSVLKWPCCNAFFAMILASNIHHLDDKNQKGVTTSDSSISLDVTLNTLEVSLSQQPTETGITN